MIMKQINKTEIMTDLKFCQSLMNRLVKSTEKYECESWTYIGFTRTKDDIKRLRRELMNVAHKLEGGE